MRSRPGREDGETKKIFWGLGHKEIKGSWVDYYLIIAPDMFLMVYAPNPEGPVYSWRNDRESVKTYSDAIRRELGEQRILVKHREAENDFEFSKLERALNFLARNKEEDVPEWFADEHVMIIAENIGLPPHGNLGQEIEDEI
jgi:hypothetical protein